MLHLVDEQGQGLVEYALILVLVSIAVIVVMRTLAPQIAAVFQQVVDALSTV